MGLFQVKRFVSRVIDFTPPVEYHYYTCSTNVGTAVGQHSLSAVGQRVIDRRVAIAVGESSVILHRPPHLVGVSIGTERERHQNDSHADG